MRIALISFHSCPVAKLGEKDTGGMNVYVLQLAMKLGMIGHQVDVYTRTHDTSDPEVINLGVGARVVHLDAGDVDEKKQELLTHTMEFVSKITAYSEKYDLKYDLIHSHYWLSGHIGRILSSHWGSCHVATFHTLAETKLRARAGEIEPPLRAMIEKEVMDTAHGILVLTQMEVKDIRTLYGIEESKMSVIPAGVDTQLFRPRNKHLSRATVGLPQDKEIVLYVGRVEPIKGLDILLESISIVRSTRDVNLVIVGGSLDGDRELEALKSRSKELGIENDVIFTGSIGQSDVSFYYSSADVFALPSHYESFGLAALEAMACGIPIVASRVGGIPSFVKDGTAGYLIPWRCPEPFANRMEMILANNDLKAVMGRAAREIAVSMDWNKTAFHVSALYRGVMSEYMELAAI